MADIEVPTITLGFQFTAPGSSTQPDLSVPTTIVYRFTLDGTVIPIKSIQARYRDAAETYLSVIVPDGIKYGNIIAAGQGGSMILERGAKYLDGTIQWVEIMRVTNDAIRDYWGGSSRSINVEGHASYVNPAPKTLEIQNATYRLGGTGVRRFRTLGLDFNLRPGDSATVDGETVIVDNITYTVDATYGEVMEYEEQL